MKTVDNMWYLFAKGTVSLIFGCVLLLSLTSCSASYQKRHFLSDDDPAYKALEAEQAIAFSEEPLAIRWTGSRKDIRKARKFLKESGDQPPGANLGYPVDQSKLIDSSVSAFAKMRTLPTRFENPMAYSILSNTYQRIRNADIYNHPTDIRFGTLPTRTIGAESGQLRGVTNRFIIVNDKTFEAIQLLLTSALDTVDIAVAGNGKWQVTSRLGKDLKETLELNPDMVVRFQLVILFLIDVNNLDRMDFSKYPILVEVFSDGMEFFLMAHEYGHIVKQHVPVDLQPLQLRDVPLGSSGMKTALHSWNQEMEADQFAMSLMVKHLENEHMSRTFQSFFDAATGRGGDARGRLQFLECEITSPLLLFRFYQILAEANHLKEHGDLPPAAKQSISKDTSLEMVDMFMAALRTGHPPAELRKGLVMRALDQLRGKPLGSHPDQRIMDNYELGWFLERNLGELWDQVKPMIPGLVKLALEDQPHP